MARNPLTPRQTEIVRLLSLGCTAKEAAKILKLSPHTVDNHKARAMIVLRTTKMAILTRIAIQLKITSLNDKLTPDEKRKRGKKKPDGWND